MFTVVDVVTVDIVKVSLGVRQSTLPTVGPFARVEARLPMVCADGPVGPLHSGCWLAWGISLFLVVFALWRCHIMTMERGDSSLQEASVRAMTAQEPSEAGFGAVQCEAEVNMNGLKESGFSARDCEALGNVMGFEEYVFSRRNCDAVLGVPAWGSAAGVWGCCPSNAEVGGGSDVIVGAAHQPLVRDDASCRSCCL